MSTTHHELHHKLYTLIPVSVYSLYMLQSSLPSLQPHLLYPQARLQWKRCADAPAEMFCAHVVVMGEKVYVGGGVTENKDDAYYIFQYNTSGDEWSRLPPHPRSLICFAMAHFTGHLITVGGGIKGSGATGKVYRFKEVSQEWEEFLQPMPTARFCFSVATTQSAIIAIGGATGVRDGKNVPCATVEMYSNETSQWYTADPLPAPYYLMSSITIAGTCYLLGGRGANNKPTTAVLYAHLASLVQKAISHTHQSASRTSVWKTLPDTPLKASAVASLSGNLLAVGGHDTKTTFPAINVYFPLTNSWVRLVGGDLPEPCTLCTAVQLSSNTMIVIGGWNNQDKLTKTVFIGTVTV